MILLSLKVVLQILALFIAMIANGLSYIFPDRRTTKFKSWRKWLFVLSGVFLIVSIVATIIDSSDSAKKEEKSKSQIEKLQTQNSILQNGIYSAANPISEVTISYELSISLETPTGIAYRSRIERAISELSKKSNGLWKMGTIMGSEGIVQRINITTPTYMPSEDKEFSAYVVLNLPVLSVSFHKNPIPNDTLVANESNADLQVRTAGSIDGKFPTRNDSQGSRLSLIYELQEKRFTINAANLPSLPYYQSKNGQIVAVPDLSETQMVIQLVPANTLNPKYDAEIKQIYKSINMERLTIRMSGGREFSFSQTDLQKYPYEDGLLYVCQFPKII